MESELELDSDSTILVGDGVKAMDGVTESESELEDSPDFVLVSDGVSATETLMESELDCTGVVLI